jgi:ankyrin repeat protein
MITRLQAQLAVCLSAVCWCSISCAETTAEALFTAIRAQQVPTIERLLAAEPQLASATDARGRSAVLTALMLVSGESFLPPPRNASLQALLKREPTLSFFESCATGNLDHVRAALAKDASLSNGWHPTGLSALHFAAFSGDAAVTTLLLDKGAALDPELADYLRTKGAKEAAITADLSKSPD